jgi:membrane associated rhomboid family serine protease
VYLVLQDGLAHWFNPVTIPDSAWSYFYPLGVLTAAFSHGGPGHLVGNLTSTVVVMPLAEYAFGHFTTTRGATSFSSWRRNPWIRALVLFPAGVLAVGLVTALWSWGPIIGFSGVVFAAVGFGLVRYPLAAVVALTAQNVVVTLYRALYNPILTRTASQRFVSPGWAGIAVQGHALGIFLGATLAVFLLWRRGTLQSEGPRPLRIWTGTVLVSAALSLWALWWIRGPQTYVLYRAAGFVFVMVVGLVVTLAVVSSDRDLFAGRPSTAGHDLLPHRLFTSGRDLLPRGSSGPDAGRSWTVTRRQTAVFGGLVVPILVMAAVAAVVNLNTVREGAPEGTDPVEVGDYQVIYAENIPYELVNVVQWELAGETTDLKTSGVIVISEQREIWSREVPPGRLAADGQASVVVGGPGWRETVVAFRRGWSAFGGGTAYKVWIGKKGAPAHLAFTSDPATADAKIAGYNVSVVPDEGGFFLRLSRNGSTAARAEMPDAGGNVTLQNVTFTRTGRTVRANYGNTTVTVAKRETYN